MTPFYFLLTSLLLAAVTVQSAFVTQTVSSSTQPRPRPTSSHYLSASITQAEAQKGIDKVVVALRKDKSANEELGKLQKVNNILGYGSPSPGKLLLRFNASFQKGGFGRSAMPMPFGLGQTNKSEGRGTMVGQVKAEVIEGKVTSCSVFRDLGYGRSFNLKC
jgi:hypothetical protein